MNSRIIKMTVSYLMYVSQLVALPAAQFGRPSYAPSPSSHLISQIVPPGKPWPANAADYNAFSQTTQRPNMPPMWATTRTPPIDDRLPSSQPADDKQTDINSWTWSRPTIIFHEPFLRQNGTSLTSASSTATPSTTRGPTTIVSEMAPLVPIKLPDFELFTSAPLKKTGEGLLQVANLLPEDVAVTIPRNTSASSRSLKN